MHRLSTVLISLNKGHRRRGWGVWLRAYTRYVHSPHYLGYTINDICAIVYDTYRRCCMSSNCEYPGCKNMGASRGKRFPGKRARFCKAHRKNGPILRPKIWNKNGENISKETVNPKNCEYPDCRNLASLLMSSKRGRFCKRHSKVGPKEFPSDWRKSKVYSENRICLIDGCSRLGSPSKRKDGSIRRGNTCSAHRINGTRTDRKGLREELEKEFNGSCQVCRWKGPCDLHRKIPGKDGGKYTKENVMFICPNCHRLEHIKAEEK